MTPAAEPTEPEPRPTPFRGPLSALVERARRRAVPGRRSILGITGAPGSGKGTVARQVCQALGPAAVVVPMDGFHLANAELVRLGRRERKGAPDTFDVDGYLSLLRRIRDQGDRTVYAPDFRREIEEPVAGSVPVPPEVPLVITEGNYLLLDTGPWAGVRELLDEVWFLRPDDTLRRQRLIGRHVQYGKTPDAARAWALGNDETNTALVAATAARADLIVLGDPLPD